MNPINYWPFLRGKQSAQMLFSRSIFQQFVTPKVRLVRTTSRVRFFLSHMNPVKNSHHFAWRTYWSLANRRSRQNFLYLFHFDGTWWQTPRPSYPNLSATHMNKKRSKRNAIKSELSPERKLYRVGLLNTDEQLYWNMFDIEQWRGACGGVVVKALRYKLAGRGFDSQWCHWNFSVT